MEWHISRNGEQFGPYPEEQVRHLLQNGTLQPTDWAWHEGMTDWKPLGEKIQSASPGQSMGGASRAMAIAGLPLASRWARLGAYILDGIIYMLSALPGLLLMLPTFMEMVNDPNMAEPDPVIFMFPSLIVIAGVIIVLVWQVVWLTTRGQTIGKRICKIRIVTAEDQELPGFVKAFLLRSFVNGLICSIPFGIGSVYALVDILFIFRSDKRCIHDFLAGTIVIEA